MTIQQKSDDTDNEQPFISHLVELRDRLLRIIIVISVALIALFPLSNTIYLYVAAPLIKQMPAGSGMIAVGVATPFMAPFKLTFLAAVVLTVPYTLYEMWAFIAPGLYLKERKLIMPLLISSTLLFYTGIAFVYYLVFPLIFGFFLATAPPGIAVMTDISQYLDFVLALFLAFGIIFEIPIATVLLVWMGILTPEMLIGQRSYIIVGAFTIGMFLTPPDPFSQTLLALPMWLLFEAGVFFSRFFVTDQLLQHPISPISQPLTDTDIEAQLDAAEKQELQLLEKK
jgi:sec-independent protein translocase protein TatC